MSDSEHSEVGSGSGSTPVISASQQGCESWHQKAESSESSFSLAHHAALVQRRRKTRKLQRSRGILLGCRVAGGLGVCADVAQ